MNDTCYLVALIDIATLRIVAVGLFSDAAPTVRMTLRPAVLETYKAADFGAAYKGMQQMLQAPMWDWVRPLLAERGKPDPVVVGTEATCNCQKGKA